MWLVSTLGLPSAHALQANKEIIATIGVAPDYQEPLTADTLSRGKDPAVAKALTFLHHTS
jgi:carboxyl-terminal processing protease